MRYTEELEEASRRHRVRASIVSKDAQPARILKSASSDVIRGAWLASGSLAALVNLGGKISAA